jgi:hypothetical protein
MSERLTPSISARIAMDEIESIREDASPHAYELREYRDYAAGNQGRGMTTTEADLLGRTGTKRLADNVLRLILSTAASRLSLEGFSCLDPAIMSYLDDLWLRNAFRRLQYDVHFATLRDGNHAVSLRWKPGRLFSETGRVTLHREPWWNGETGMFVSYDEFDDPEWAVKEWAQRVPNNTQPLWRRTVYYPDRIERYQKDGQDWKRLASGGDVPWMKSDGTPLGLPVIHFANGSADDSLYGQSDLKGLLGLQDDLNAMQRDMSAASAFAGWQMLTATGINSGNDELLVGPGRMLKTANPDARFGVIPPGDMSELTGTHGYKRQTMAVDSSTPIHLILGAEWPAADAVLRVEMPLVDKVERLQEIESPSWVLVAHRSTELGNRFGRMGLNEASPITCRWEDAERLDPLTETTVQQAKVNLYASLALLDDPVLIAKTGIMDEEEAKKLLATRLSAAPVSSPFSPIPPTQTKQPVGAAVVPTVSRANPLERP